VIGYDRAAQAAKDAYKSGETIREHVLRHRLVEPKQLDRLLNPADMTKPGGKGPGGG
jgi:fumarate hydratase class II